MAVPYARGFGKDGSSNGAAPGAALSIGNQVPYTQAFGKDSAALSTILKISQVHMKVTFPI